MWYIGQPILFMYRYCWGGGWCSEPSVLICRFNTSANKQTSSQWWPLSAIWWVICTVMQGKHVGCTGTSTIPKSEWCNWCDSHYKCQLMILWRINRDIMDHTMYLSALHTKNTFRTWLSCYSGSYGFLQDFSLWEFRVNFKKLLNWRTDKQKWTTCSCKSSQPGKCHLLADWQTLPDQKHYVGWPRANPSWSRPGRNLAGPLGPRWVRSTTSWSAEYAGQAGSVDSIKYFDPTWPFRSIVPANLWIIPLHKYQRMFPECVVWLSERISRRKLQEVCF